MGLDMLPMRLEKAREGGVHLAVNVGEEDPIELSKEFTRGYGVDAGIMAFGGDATEAFETVYRMLKQAPDTHRMGRIVLISGSVTHQFGSSLGNVDIRCAARTGPGYHDEDWEHGDDYAKVFVPFTTKRNLEECLYFLETGGMVVDHLITHSVDIDDSPDACEDLIQRPNEALGVAIHS